VEVEVHEDRKFVQRLLQTSLTISVALMATGIALHLAVDGEGRSSPLRLEDLVSGNLTAVQIFLGWGILVLALTPALRVLALVVLWAKAKDWLYASVSVVVLLTLVLSVIVGKG
jgi:uncharacterized membrane protein